MQGNMETHNHVLAAGVWATVPGNGDKVFILDSSGEVDVEFYGMTGERIGYAMGMTVGDGGGPGPVFRSLRLKSAINQTVKIAVTAGTFTAARIAGTVDIDVAASLVSSADLPLVADTNTILFADSTTRKEIIIKSAKTNTVNVRIGDNNISVSQGYELEPGQTMVLQNAGAVYARAIGGAATVQRLEGKN